MSKTNATRPLRETVALCLDDWGVHSDRDESDSDDFCGWHVGSRVEKATNAPAAAAATLPDAAAAADAMGATVLGEVILNMNRAWGDMEMAILRDYAARTAARAPLVLVANGPVHHRGGKVHRRLRDALYKLTALCRTHPRAHLLTLMTDPAIRWPRRQEFERPSLSWPDGTDHAAIELAIFDERPPLIISVFRRTEVTPTLTLTLTLTLALTLALALALTLTLTPTRTLGSAAPQRPRRLLPRAAAASDPDGGGGGLHRVARQAVRRRVRRQRPYGGLFTLGLAEKAFVLPAPHHRATLPLTLDATTARWLICYPYPYPYPYP